jgi:hypothetical protein
LGVDRIISLAYASSVPVVGDAKKETIMENYDFNIGPITFVCWAASADQALQKAMANPQVKAEINAAFPGSWFPTPKVNTFKWVEGDYFN